MDQQDGEMCWSCEGEALLSRAQVLILPVVIRHDTVGGGSLSISPPGPALWYANFQRGVFPLGFLLLTTPGLQHAGLFKDR